MATFSVPGDELDASPETIRVFEEAWREWLQRAEAENDAEDHTAGLTAATSVPWDDSEQWWQDTVNQVLMVLLLAEFLAYMTRKYDGPPGDPDDPLAWPIGVDGPESLHELWLLFPWLFAGLSKESAAGAAGSSAFRRESNQWAKGAAAGLVGMTTTAFWDLINKVLADIEKWGTAAKDTAKKWFRFGDPDEPGSQASKARNAAKTSVHSARQSAAHAAAQDMAAAGSEVMVVWQTRMDDRVRAWHAEAQDQEVPLGATFLVGGEHLRYPGDPNGSPGNVINCRCEALYFDARTGQMIMASGHNPTTGDTMTTTVTDDKTVAAEVRHWTGRLAPLGEQTGDGRRLDAGGRFRFREFPLPLLFQDTTAAGHDQSRIVGVITHGAITSDGVQAEGYVYGDEERVIRLLEDGVLRPSVDMCDTVFDYEEADGDEVMVMSVGTVMGATLVATPAFENVNVSLTAATSVSVAEESLVASAASVAALPTYDTAAFTNPGLDGPTPVTVDRDTGRVYGHLALWDSCHTGMPDKCVMPPRSATGYSSFHQSTVVTEAGERLAVGRLTVGGGHANPQARVRAAAEHYDHTGTCWAYVKAGEDQYGIWVAGQVNPAATTEQLAAAETSALSGDWRRVGASMELVAALSVNTPGFPVRREFSADGQTVDTLVASASIESRCEDSDASPTTEAGDDFQRGVRYERLRVRTEARDAQRRQRRMSVLQKRMGAQG